MPCCQFISTDGKQPLIGVGLGKFRSYVVPSFEFRLKTLFYLFIVYPHLMQSALCFLDDEIPFPYFTNVISAYMSACVGHVPLTFCNQLEDVLLTNLTSVNPYKFMLASDLLYCLARCGFRLKVF